MRIVVVMLVALLFVLHQDFWWWDSIDPLIFGFVPITLAYHVFLSVAAGLVWLLAVMFCWPRDVEVGRKQWADGKGDVEL